MAEPLDRDGADWDCGEIFPAVRRVLEGPGKGLEPATRAEMERCFGFGFGDVRIHEGVGAAATAELLRARAYTVGRHIVFGGGCYAPGTFEGRLLLAHELAHVVQNRLRRGGRGFPAGDVIGIERSGSGAEVEAEVASWRVALGLKAGRIQHANAGLARTATSAAILPLISYSGTDWAVTSSEESRVLALLRADATPSATIRDIHAAGMLDEMIDRIDVVSNRVELVMILGGQLDAAAAGLVRPLLGPLSRPRAAGRAVIMPQQVMGGTLEWLFNLCGDVQTNLRRHGVSGAAPSFNPAPYQHLVSANPAAPFSGVGATGVSPTSRSVPFLDQADLLVGQPSVTARYSNPIPGDLGAYLSGLRPTERVQQAELMLRLPISSVITSSYAGLPSRAQVVRAAATLHRLRPALVAAFLLAEQRDQSANEDAVDFNSATSIISRNSSIGLGQVVVSTARRGDLFADLLSATSRSGLSHYQIAHLLASDEFNIFAVARYIRQVADRASRMSIASLPNTRAEFPGINLAAYGRDSSTWPDDNIRALASEYTSRAWDDELVTGWSYFVWEAYQHVRASGAL